MTEITGARVVEHREVARATRWLVLEPDDDLACAPGHIVTLYMPSGEKWVRHPYTVSLAQGTRIGILYRVIRGGRTTPFMATLTPGETLRLGGRYGEPVAALVAPEAPAVIGVSTGSGIGPLHGYAATSLGASDRPVRVLAGFREAADIALGRELDALATRHPHFRWHAALSRGGAAGADVLAGRVTANLGAVVGDLGGVSARDAHWHLVGNGAMVTDLRAGLLTAGVPAERVTTETYHNRGTSPEQAVVDGIVAALR